AELEAELEDPNVDVGSERACSAEFWAAF
ncbi:hypothetical protein JL09_g6282, partial [Pichia kudriavzevii]